MLRGPESRFECCLRIFDTLVAHCGRGQICDSKRALFRDAISVRRPGLTRSSMCSSARSSRARQTPPDETSPRGCFKGGSEKVASRRSSRAKTASGSSARETRARETAELIVPPVRPPSLPPPPQSSALRRRGYIVKYERSLRIVIYRDSAKCRLTDRRADK